MSTFNIPDEPHWAIITQETTSRYVEGDERSRTHPGHGYTGGYESNTTTNYRAFKVEDDWKRAVQILMLADKKFVAIEAKPVAFKIGIEVLRNGH